MTDQDHTTPDIDLGEAVPVDFNLDDWLDGGSVSQRSIPIYSRPDLIADYEEWGRRYDAAEERAKDAIDETALGEASDLEQLKAEGEEIYARWQASKADWRVRALDDEDEIQPIVSRKPIHPDLPEFAEPEPKQPRDFGNGKPSESYVAAHTAWKARRDAFLEAQKPEQDALDKKRSEADDDANLEMIATAVVSIEFANGVTASGVTVEQLRRMRKSIGARQVQRLLNAATLATIAEPTMPVPSSRTTSRGAQD